MKKKQFTNEKLTSFPLLISDEIRSKIDQLQAENVFYGVFPISGNSMTCDDYSKSIPHNSKVLAYDLEIDFSKTLDVIWHQVPVRETLLLMGKTPNGKDFFLCKSISNVDAVNNCITLQSYNPEFHDQTIPFSLIKSMFKVIQIVE